MPLMIMASFFINFDLNPVAGKCTKFFNYFFIVNYPGFSPKLIHV
jgi:hypothetical protein